jgi:hypothetical protein
MSIDSWCGMSVDGWGSNYWSYGCANRIDKSVLVNIFRETFEVKWASTTWSSYKITPCWGQWSSWKTRLEELRVSCWSSTSYGSKGQNDKCLHYGIEVVKN